MSAQNGGNDQLHYDVPQHQHTPEMGLERKVAVFSDLVTKME